MKPAESAGRSGSQAGVWNNPIENGCRCGPPQDAPRDRSRSTSSPQRKPTGARRGPAGSDPPITTVLSGRLPHIGLSGATKGVVAGTCQGGLDHLLTRCAAGPREPVSWFCGRRVSPAPRVGSSELCDSAANLHDLLQPASRGFCPTPELIATRSGRALRIATTSLQAGGLSGSSVTSARKRTRSSQVSRVTRRSFAKGVTPSPAGSRRWAGSREGR